MFSFGFVVNKQLVILLSALLVFFLGRQDLLAQKEANNWYFGQRAAIEFNGVNGAPVARLGSQIITQEGNATISDNNGNLLFYTDGITVWNANNIVMTNGTGLQGNFSATQSAIIVPKPGSSNNYYIFTVPATNSTVGLRYSEVDMSQSGGLGAVLTTNKNTQVTPTGVGVREKVTAVAHANGTDFWVITQRSSVGTYYAYRVSSAGVNTTGTTSTINVGSNTSYIGYLKASPSGDKLVNMQYNSSELVFMDFNSSTGAITNPFLVTGTQSPYGGDFSPDETKFYTGSRNQIYQYDITTYNAAAITASRTTIYTHSTGTMWALQLGPDGKIYCVNYGQTALSQIPNPNITGTGCGFTYNYLNLISTTGAVQGRLGLPTFIQSFFARSSLAIRDTCLGDTTTFTLGNNPQIDSVLWNFGDTMSGALNTDTAESSSHIYSDTGTYYISVRVRLVNANNLVSIDTLYDTIRIHHPPIIDLGNDTILCKGDSLDFTINTDLYEHMWLDSSDGEKLYVDTAGEYWIRAENICGIDYDTMRVDSLWPDTVNLGPDTVLCLGDTMEFDVETVAGTGYLWDSGDTTSFFSTDTSGFVSVQLSNVCGTFSDIAYVDFERPPKVDLGGDTLLCDGTILVKNAAFSRSTYLWQNGSQSSLTNIFSPGGTFWVEVTNQCGQASDTLQVDYDYPLNVVLGPDSLLCQGDVILLDPGLVRNAQMLWSDGSTDSTLSITTMGDYWVQASNACGVYSDSIYFDDEVVPVVELPLDTILCIGDTIGFSGSFSRSTYLWNDGGTDTSITITSQTKVWLEATNICGLGSDTVTVYYDQPLDVDLGPDTNICNSNTLTLDVTVPNKPTYWWNTGVSGPVYTIVETGVYNVKIENTCGIYEDEIRVIYEYTPDIYLGSDTVLCEGKSYRIELPALQNAEVTWSDGSQFDVVQASKPGIYWAQAQNRCGLDVDSIEVFYSDKPRPNLGGDQLLCPGELVELSATIEDENEYSYFWNTFEFHSTILISDPGTYSVRVENIYGCIGVDSLEFKLCDQYLYIPSAFSPNKDGLNESFKVYGERLEDVEVSIVNRWGEKIYESDAVNFAWDGTYKGEDCEIGTYTYYLSYPDLDNQLQIKVGTFQLIR